MINIFPLKLLFVYFLYIDTIMTTNNDNMGLLTKIWGPPLWESLHCITFAFPSNPTNEEKQHYLAFFKSLGNVLPCSLCRSSYN